LWYLYGKGEVWLCFNQIPYFNIFRLSFC
jgi:hypothetical protein